MLFLHTVGLYITTDWQS